MSRKKREHSAAFKAKVALAAIKEELTQNQITSKYSIHTTQIRNWKERAITAIQECFTKKRQRDEQQQEELITSLYEQIGRLQTQLNWIKKRWI